MSNRNLIFGLGSGRCGTKSLSDILGLPHESGLLPWEFTGHRYREVMPAIARQGGDVSMSWLSYVERILGEFSKSKFICLKREREATCKSWDRNLDASEKFELATIWRYRGSGKIEWGSLFPDYGDMPVHDAIRKYYDEYYAICDDLAERYPENFRIFESPRVLGHRRDQRRMLEWAGSDRSTNIKSHKNKGDSRKKGNRMRNISLAIARKTIDGSIGEEDAKIFAEKISKDLGMDVQGFKMTFEKSEQDRSLIRWGV